jgi:hypothetical protein
MHGKCPKCEKLVIYATYSTPDIKQLGGHSWKGISINCSFCQTVLSIAIDPIAIKSDIVAEIKKMLGR